MTGSRAAWAQSAVLPIAAFDQLIDRLVDDSSLRRALFDTEDPADLLCIDAGEVVFPACRRSEGDSPWGLGLMR